MTLRLATSDPGFAAAFDALVDARREADADVSRDVAAIVADVRERGDAAVIEHTRRLDGHDLDRTGWAVGADERRAALAGLDPTLREALELAASRIRSFAESQRPADSDIIDAEGVRMGSRWLPVDAAGLYVPGGRAAYPSSVLMNAIPARVAGVARLAMVTPTPGGVVDPLVLAAAELAGVDEVWRIGGAQAIAALAFGTDRIAPVDVAVGPGNAWVAEAKRQLYGVVGTDMVAGPSEILVIADSDNEPSWIAADLLSQAEHDPTSQSILITDDESFADAVRDEVERQLDALAAPRRRPGSSRRHDLEIAQAAAVSSPSPRRSAGNAQNKTARVSWHINGAIIVVRDLAEAPALIDRLAPEHLELAVADPEALFARVRHAGSVFLGRNTPEAVGDYVGGPNHVLPTGRRARFASGLSVLDFMKRTSFLSCDQAALAKIGPAAVALAEAEGLPAHAASVALRL